MGETERRPGDREMLTLRSNEATGEYNNLLNLNYFLIFV